MAREEEGEGEGDFSSWQSRINLVASLEPSSLLFLLLFGVFLIKILLHNVVASLKQGK